MPQSEPMIRVINHSPVVHEHGPKGRNGWRYTPGCTCGWRFSRPLAPSLCLAEWVAHLEVLDGGR